jgi:hypothetical protein
MVKFKKMKMVIKKIILAAIVFFYCCTNPQNNNNMNNLRIKLKASFSGQIGYGEVYKCEVIDVIQGQLVDDSITITILSTDANYSNILSKKQAPEILEVTFNKKEDNVKYSLMPISGMVDKNKTSWIIKEIKESEK